MAGFDVRVIPPTDVRFDWREDSASVTCTRCGLREIVLSDGAEKSCACDPPRRFRYECRLVVVEPGAAVVY